MRVVMTGGQGFLGKKLIGLILEEGLVDRTGTRRQVERVDVLDLAASPHSDDRVSPHLCDLTDRAELDGYLNRGDEVSVFHLASMVSAESELDWSGAVNTNIGGLINLLEAAAACGRPPKLLFASSLAVFGGRSVEHAVGDGTKQTSQTTYGMTKSVGEALVNDASRKGFVDGRSARLPTVIVRAGRPNRAASGFFSGVFREPLNGERCIVPVAPETEAVVIGVAAAIRSMVGLHDIDSSRLGHDRAVSLPGITVSVAEMIDTLGEIGGAAATEKLDFEFDAAIDAVVRSWPTGWIDEPARSLGLVGDESLRAIVEEYSQSI